MGCAGNPPGPVGTFASVDAALRSGILSTRTEVRLRRLVSMLCVLALGACAGGAARTGLPPAGPGAGLSGGAAALPGAGQAAPRSGIGLSTRSIAFTGIGWDATQVVKTTWSDDSRKTAVTSDPLVATVSPPFQLAAWIAPNAYGAKYWITPVGAGTATITFSDHDGAESAQLSVSVVAPPTGTLYVAGTSEVDAFPPAANGSTVPDRRITGFYHASTPPFHHNGSGVGTIGTAADGTLYVLKNYQVGVMNFECDAISESATAGGSSGWLGTFPCVGVRGYGVAPGLGGEIDVLVIGYSSASTVQRFVGGRLTSSLTVPGSPPAFGGLATDTSGNIFVSSYTATTTVSGEVLEYAAGAADGAAPIRTIAAPAGDAFGAIAVAADGTLYATLDVPNFATGAGTNSIYAYPSGATSPSRTLGPFVTDAIAGLACNKGGELYVAFNSGAQGSRVDVYAPNANGNAMPVRTIPNPIPSNTVGGPAIVGISLGPPQPLPPEQVLSRRRHL
jgi:hypothetical protein